MVTNNGLGMSAQQHTRLFDLVQRLQAHVEVSGVGFIYMVKRLPDNASGTITVQSQPG